MEFPDISTKFMHSDAGYYMKLYVTAMTVYTAPDAAGYCSFKCPVPSLHCLKIIRIKHNAFTMIALH